MAQAGFTPIVIYHSTTGAAVPTAGNLVPGELALNINDMKLYCENSSGVVTLLASASGSSGDVVGPASSTDNAIVRFDGTTGKLVQNSGVTIDDSGNMVVSVNSATDALRITQTGAGNALVVEDSANPDSSPFVVDAAGQVAIGSSTSTAQSFRVAKAITGSATAFSIINQAAVQSDVTTTASMFYTGAATQAASFTLSSLNHYSADQNTFGASSIVSDQRGFVANSSLTGATNNYGFFSNIAAPTSGITTTGTVTGISSSGTTVTVNHDAITYTNGQTVTVTATANATALVSGATCTILSVGSTDFTLIGAANNTVGTSFTATGAGTGSGTVTLNVQGSGKTVASAASGSFSFTTSTSQTFTAVAATGSVTVSQRWNLYANGTAANYLGGNTIINGAVGVGSAGSPSYGAAGEVLTSQGSSSPPIWAAASSSTSIGLVRAIAINCILP